MSTANTSSARVTTPAEQFDLRPTTGCAPRCAVTQPGSSQPQIEIEVTNMLRPKEIQARIRAGASVEQVAAAAGVEVSRSRALRPSGAAGTLPRRRAGNRRAPGARRRPRGADAAGDRHHRAGVPRPRPRQPRWDAWRNEDSRWTVQLAWKAGRSDNVAHFRFTPARTAAPSPPSTTPPAELIDPNFERPLRPVAPVAQLDFERARAEAAAPMEPPAAARDRAEKPARTRRRQAGRCRRGKTCCSACARAASARRDAPAKRDSRDGASASSASQAPATPTAAAQHEPAQHRRTPPPPQRRRQPAGRHDVEPDGQQRCTRTSPRLSTTIAAAVTAATNPATVKPVAQGTDSSRISRSLV